MIRHLKTAAILLTAVSWMGCDTSQPAPIDRGDAGTTLAPLDKADAGTGTAPTTSPPSGLTNFFGAGNFATLTVPVAGGEPEVLSIKALDVKVEVIGRMARTQVTQVFHNHTSSRTEGSYEFTLPEGAAISRLAMDVEGKMMEGELVERERARQIYESIVRQQKDPALLEWQGGNRFKTQIFPIEANSDKTVVLTYEQILPRSDRGAAYRYSMPNLSGKPDGSKIGAFTFKLLSEDSAALSAHGYPAKVAQRQPGGQVTFEAQSFLPAGPLEVRFQPPGSGAPQVRYAVRKGERFFLADFIPSLPAFGGGQSPSLVLLMDTSAGIGQIELGRAVGAAKALLSALPQGAQVQVIHGDIKARRCGEGSFSIDAAKRCLDGLEAGGATDLMGLLMAAIAVEVQGPMSIVAFTDGSASLGELDGDLIAAGVVKSMEGREVSLHTVAIGHSPDPDFLAGLASRARGHATRMTPVDAPAAIAARLGALIKEPLLTGVKVEVISGAVEGLVPHKPVNLARGEALAVMGRLDQGAATIKVSGQWRGQTISKQFALAAPASGDDRLLVNFWARQVIEEMQDKGIKRDKVVATSLQYGVMSRYTSFLVLENDAAYKRFKIERRKEKERVEQEAQKTTNLKKSTGNLQDMLAANDGKGRADEGRFGDPDRDGEEEGEEADSDDDDDEAPEEKSMAERRVVANDPAAPEPAKAEAPFEPRVARQPRPRSSATRSGDRANLGIADDVGGFGGGGGGLKAKKVAPGYRGRRFDWRADRLKILEPRKNALSPQEQIELMNLYGQLNKAPQARAFLKLLLAKVPPEKRSEETLRLLTDPRLQTLMSREFLAAARARLAQPNPPESVLRGVWNHLMAKGGGKALIKEFGAVKMIPTTAGGFLLQLVQSKKVADAQALFAAWKTSGKYTGGEFYQILTNNRQLAVALPKALYGVSLALVKEGDSRPEVMADLVATTPEDKISETAPLVLTRCKLEDADLKQCAVWLGKLSADEAVKTFLVTMHAKRLGELRAARQQDMGNPALIKESAKLLAEIGKQEASDRMLSELVEFTPHDHTARTRYAVALIQKKDIEGGCAQYAAAVQLNPSERDTFKTMMRLRRSHSDKAQAIRSCIIDSVSKLPVQRAISLILTWEDPTADVDLHIDEQAGEHVYYQHRESELGGLLYYDITDGFGPEIYVLGSGPSGEYKLSLVYYSGSARDLRGTLTILRNAGTPQETREERQFVLPTSNDSTRIPIGVFRL